MRDSHDLDVEGVRVRGRTLGGDARARRALANAYRLLADLIAGPLDLALLERARKSPLLSDALGEDPDLDEVAAAHHRAFEWSVFPHQGVFLDLGGWADGTSSESLRSLFSVVGYSSRTELPADHLSNILGALALAVEGGVDEVSLAELESSLLDRHLLRWLPLFVAAVRRLRVPFPAAMVGQLEDLVLYHRELLELPVDASELEGSVQVDLLEDPDTGLAEIASHLLSPPQTGIFLSREDILSVARESGCFCGFGDRQTMLLNALRTAVQHDRIREFTGALSELHREEELSLTRRIDEGLPEELATPLAKKSSETRALLQLIGAAGRSFSPVMTVDPARPGAT
jgi:TorA maturation chaperone TorD